MAGFDFGPSNPKYVPSRRVHHKYLVMEDGNRISVTDARLPGCQEYTRNPQESVLDLREKEKIFEYHRITVVVSGVALLSYCYRIAT